MTSAIIAPINTPTTPVIPSELVTDEVIVAATSENSAAIGIGDESVLINLDNGYYYTVNPAETGQTVTQTDDEGNTKEIATLGAKDAYHTNFSMSCETDAETGDKHVVFGEGIVFDESTTEEEQNGLKDTIRDYVNRQIVKEELRDPQIFREMPYGG